MKNPVGLKPEAITIQEATAEEVTAIPVHVGDDVGYDLVLRADQASPRMAGSAMTVVSLLDFACTSCGQRVSLTRVSDPRRALPPDDDGDDMDNIALLHDTPACRRYLELDLVEFLRANRRDMGISDEMVDEMEKGARN